jgi:hypothetical protein
MDRNAAVAWLVGAWFALTLFMALVATHNFKAVDAILGAPAAAAEEPIGKLGPEGARALMRYQASELNRFFFRCSESAQLVLWPVILILTRKRSVRVLGSAVLAALAAESLFLTPKIIALGRTLDFDPASANRAAFWRLHGAYSSLEVAKWALGAAAAWKVLRSGSEAEPGHSAF